MVTDALARSCMYNCRIITNELQVTKIEHCLVHARNAVQSLIYFGMLDVLSTPSLCTLLTSVQTCLFAHMPYAN